ncbi:uncharacterized protein PGTG_08505 [Puccinia graminis f. sp. tritici CRL 75-36-700-3]|uniref:Uncharacterized protein n=1 Tax=Puccinia graminis f. sp. tritici (strain CRL 75-36-700-3 / race SCCL) TaxID=418459 RepID=E3KE00_PUCGT|nr:uncharacterized protein PGTG_08505 [Puccinia graminis f. sp. tritici CRL 75-36-700-3]EFP82549.2 hypothetical protein PGTG_08505 [Puccinia graminis f. sp. tritici CRL 75-36-700-3]
MLFEDKTEAGEILEYILSQQYLEAPQLPMKTTKSVSATSNTPPVGPYTQTTWLKWERCFSWPVLTKS